MKTATRSVLRIVAPLALALSQAFAGPGAWDGTYVPLVSGYVYTMGLQSDGKLVLGGAFSSVNGSSARARLARLLSDGSLDATFFSTGSGVAGTVWSLSLQTDGRIVIGGDFSAVNSTSRYRVARLNPNGTVDGTFIPTNSIGVSVLAVAAQSDNKVVIGGSFNGGVFPSWNARLNADGTTDTSFSSFPNGAVYAIAIQPDGKILIGGAFTTANGASRSHIARLNSDGSLDNTFQNGLSGASANVRCLQLQTDGKILIGGDFTSVNNTSRSYVARLNSNGSLDTGFISYPGANGPVYALAVQPDNTVLLGGNFTTYASANLSHVARLYADGTRDTAYTNFGINNIVQALAVQSDGGTLVGGLFTAINNTNQASLGRLYGNLYPPEFALQPRGRNTNVGANVTFSAQVNNPTSTSFQWRKDGNNLSGATGTAYSLFNVQLADAGNYSVFVSNGFGGTTSTNALLQVGIAPALTSQSGSLSVAQGQSASFTVTATGLPLNYFWKKNSVFIPGQTNSLLSFSSVFPTNAATYTCLVSNFLGNVTSTGAVLSISFPPTISVQPAGQTVGVGSNFTVSVTASGNPALSYQWRTNGNAAAAATNASYTVANAQTYHSGDYDVIITNSLGSITSSVAAISVVYYPPSISQQPVGGNVPVGSNLTMTVSASGTAPLNWRWRKDGSELSAANSNSFSLTAAQLSDAGSYDVVVANSTASVTSSVAVVNVGYLPVVTQQPMSATNTLGGSNTFSCIVTGSAPISLQWTFYGSLIPEATNATLALTNLQPAHFGSYALTATNAFGGTVSSSAVLNLGGLYTLIQPAALVLNPTNFGLDASRFSARLALSGDHLAVGQATDSGLIHQFSSQSNVLAKLSTVTPPDTVYDAPVFGNSLGLEGDLLYAGCPNTWRSAPHDGTAYLYNHLTSSPSLASEWTELPGQAAGYFGTHGCLVGDSLVVSQGSNPSYGSKAGAFFYRVDAAGNQASVFSFFAPDTDRDVEGLALSSNRCAVLLNSRADNNDCQILVFDLQRDVTNGLLAIATNTIIAATNFSGPALLSTGCDDAWVALGEPQYALGTNPCGRVRLWRVVGGSASLVATLYPPDMLAGGNYGECVYLRNNTLIVGSPTAPGFAGAQGCVYIYALPLSGQPGTPKKLQPTNPALGSGEFFGNPICGDSQRVIIGSAGGAERIGTGAVYIYDTSALAPQMVPSISISRSAVGGLTLTVTGMPGASYILQSATNLVAPALWQSICTNAADTNGLWMFAETNIDSAQKFYRVSAP